MLFFRLVVISTVFLSAGMMLIFSVPVIADFAVYEVPLIYNGVVSWLRPPYLYLVINCIIITIVASSMLQSTKDEDASLPVKPLDTNTVVQDHVEALDGKRVEADEYEYNGVVLNSEDDSDAKAGKGLDFDAYEKVEQLASRIEKEVDPFVTDAAIGINFVFAEDATSNKENECVISKSTWNAPDKTENPLAIVKAPVSARFGHRRNLKASPEGGKVVLGVSKPKKQDTLESTWKTITEGRSMPLTRHLRKNETWERTSSPKVTMTKAETFCDRTNAKSPPITPSPGSGKLKKEPSLSQDELNRRVEAFIKKFNEEMRLQRQESLNQYVQMVSRSSC